MLKNIKINSPDCVNLSLSGIDYKPHMTGFIYTDMKEVWKSIKGYEGIYEVSNLGKVRSLDRFVKSRFRYRKIKGNILKNNITKKGYYTVSLCNSTQHNKLVHILVWDHFGNNKRDGLLLQVDHINNDKSNNSIFNLQLLTPRDNVCKSRNLPSTGIRHIHKYPYGYRIVIHYNKKKYSVCGFKTINEAIIGLKTLKRKLYVKH